jgi:hypothetical protein
MEGDKDKKQLLLRLSPALWRELAAWSEDEFRSINGQIEYLLTECVRQRRGGSAEKQAAKQRGDDDDRT